MSESMEWAQIVEDYVNSLAWPAVAVIFICLFRTRIGALIDRIQKGKVAGIEFDSPTQPDPPEPPEGLELVDQDQGAGQSEAGQAPTQVDLEKIALARLVYFERLYRLMHGTQIALLRYLNRFHTVGAGVQTLQPFYQTHRERGKALGVTSQQAWDSYVGFLLQAQLIQPVQGGYCITAIGRDFLQWTVSEGVPEDKLL
ncbi:MAG: hypothetical protein WD904_05495 [Dehalococcoidia bacterium]